MVILRIWFVRTSGANISINFYGLLSVVVLKFVCNIHLERDIPFKNQHYFECIAIFKLKRLRSLFTIKGMNLNIAIMALFLYYM